MLSHWFNTLELFTERQLCFFQCTMFTKMQIKFSRPLADPVTLLPLEPGQVPCSISTVRHTSPQQSPVSSPSPQKLSEGEVGFKTSPYQTAAQELVQTSGRQPHSSLGAQTQTGHTKGAERVAPRAESVNCRSRVSD